MPFKFTLITDNVADNGDTDTVLGFLDTTATNCESVYQAKEFPKRWIAGIGTASLVDADWVMVVRCDGEYRREHGNTGVPIHTF